MDAGQTQMPKLRGNKNAASGVDMDSSQGMSGNDKDVLAEKVVESIGEPAEAVDEINQSHDSVGHENTDDPLFVQKRLKQQKRAHDREMREMQARMAELQAQVSPSQHNMAANQYGYQNENSGHPDETIQKAVSFALQQRDLEERKAKDAHAQAEIAKQYQHLQKHLDQTSDKYDDFEDVVRGSDAPFTSTIRDAALLLPKKGAGSAGEVLYKLGKNPEELDRISKLLPHEQASEVIKLSHALISGGENKGSSPRPLGTIKANPVSNSAGVTEKTSPSQIRALMKAGKFK